MKTLVGGTGLGPTLAALALAASLAACGDPELSDEGKEAEGSSDPTAETGSPAPGIPPRIDGS